MIAHLVPYERMYLSITLNLDEATEVSDSLELLKVMRKNKALPPSAEKLQLLLAANIDKAVQLQKKEG
jgi:hypothetical protein